MKEYKILKNDVEHSTIKADLYKIEKDKINFYKKGEIKPREILSYNFNDEYEYELIATFPNNNEYIIIKNDI